MRLRISLLMVLTAWLGAQTNHSVILTWADKVYPARTTYNVYRGVGMCSGTHTFSKLASGLTAKTYQDTTVIPGDYCYAVTVQLNGIESAQSHTAGAHVPPPSP